MPLFTVPFPSRTRPLIPFVSLKSKGPLSASHERAIETQREQLPPRMVKKGGERWVGRWESNQFFFAPMSSHPCCPPIGMKVLLYSRARLPVFRFNHDIQKTQQ